MRVEKNISYTYIPKLVFYTLGNMYRNKIYIIAYYFPQQVFKKEENDYERENKTNPSFFTTNSN